MKTFLIVNQGLEQVSAQEVKEILNVKAKTFPEIVEFDANKEELLLLTYRLQSVRRLLIAVGKFKEAKELDFSNFKNWSEFFTSETAFKVTIENVHGEENRQALAKQVAGALFQQFRKVNLEPKIELKKPQVEVIVYFNEQEYFCGIDFCGKELDAREYRVFPHSASFKGDLSYYFIRQSGFKAGEKLLVGFCKDGSIPIEAALFAAGLSMRSWKKRELSFFNFPMFKEFDFSAYFQKTFSPPEAAFNIFGFDENLQNIIAARKNSLLAGTKQVLELEKYCLDDLDVKFKEHYFDRLLFYLTTKDEEQLNEIYYQTNYILKAKGTLLLITRKNFELAVSNKLTLLKEEIIYKGDSAHKMWVLEKL